MSCDVSDLQNFIEVGIIYRQKSQRGTFLEISTQKLSDATQFLYNIMNALH